MSIALSYIWIVPVAIGVAATYHFAMKDLKTDESVDKELRD